jgi:hypothetical protein
MSDLVTRILDCVPPGTYGMHALFRLVDIVESDDVPTAAIEGGHAPRMLVNPVFAARHAATPERLLMLVMHELHHVILGHTRLLPVSTPLDNIVFDAVINAMLCRAFPDPRGIALFTGFYAAHEVPAALLRPAVGWDPDRPTAPSRALLRAGHRHLASVHQALYSPGGVAYEELHDALLEACPPAQAAGAALLGDHGEGSLCGGDLEARAPVLLDVVRRIVEEWPQPPEPIAGRSLATAFRESFAPPRRVAGNRARLRTLLRWAGGLTDRGTVRTTEPIETAVLTPLRSRARRDVVADLLGSPILLHEGAATGRGRTRAGERVHVYLDVSGSVSGLVGVLSAAIRDCAPFVHPVIHAFSTEIADHSLAELAAGRIRTTGGTDVRCIAAHARSNHIRRAVILTDGYVGQAAGIDAETLAGMRLAVAYTDNRFTSDLAPFAGRTDTLEVAA